MRRIKYLDILLILAGNRLSSRFLGFRRLGSLINCLFRIMILAANAIVTCRLLAEIVATGATPFNAAYIICSIFQILTMILYAVRRPRVKYLLRKILIGDAYRSVIEKACLRWLLFALTSITVHIISNSLQMSLVLSDPGNLLFAIIVALPIILNQFLVLYPIFYMIIMKLLTNYELHHLDSIKTLVKNDSRDVNRILDKMADARDTKVEFEQLFNFIPFITFGTLFVTIPGVILSAMKDMSLGRDMSYVIQEVVAFASVHIAIFIVNFFLVQSVSMSKEIVNQNIAELIRLVQRRNIRNLNTTGYQSVIEELRIDQQFSFTGWYLFTINRFILLGFLSAIISFSVLLIQLGNSQ